MIQSDLLIPQLEVTIRPLKGHLKFPKKVTFAESPGMDMLVLRRVILLGAYPDELARISFTDDLNLPIL